MLEIIPISPSKPTGLPTTTRGVEQSAIEPDLKTCLDTAVLKVRMKKKSCMLTLSAGQ